MKNIWNRLMIDQILQKNRLVNQKTYSKQNTEKRIPSDENGLSKIRNSFEQPNIDVIGVSTGREAKKKNISTNNVHNNHPCRLFYRINNKADGNKLNIS